MITTITQDTSALAAAMFAIGGGKFRLHKDRHGYIDVLDDNDHIIGSAIKTFLNGYAVMSRPFAGYVSDDQIVWT